MGDRRRDGDRWAALFADLSGEFAAAGALELTGEVADRARAERGRQRLVDRLRAARGRPVRARVRTVGAVVGRLRDVGPDWVLIGEEFGRDALVPVAALLSVSGLGVETRPPLDDGAVEARIDLRHALRRLMRDRASVRIILLDGGEALTGTVDRVGADFVEVAEHGPGEPRRRSAVRGVVTVPLGALAVVRSQGRSQGCSQGCSQGGPEA